MGYLTVAATARSVPAQDAAENAQNLPGSARIADERSNETFGRHHRIAGHAVQNAAETRPPVWMEVRAPPPPLPCKPRGELAQRNPHAFGEYMR